MVAWQIIIRIRLTACCSKHCFSYFFIYLPFQTETNINKIILKPSLNFKKLAYLSTYFLQFCLHYLIQQPPSIHPIVYLCKIIILSYEWLECRWHPCKESTWFSYSIQCKAHRIVTLSSHQLAELSVSSFTLHVHSKAWYSSSSNPSAR